MTILENLSIADNKGKTYGLGCGTNHSRIEHYKEMLAELNLGLEDKLHTKVGGTFRRSETDTCASHGYDESNRVSNP